LTKAVSFRKVGKEREEIMRKIILLSLFICFFFVVSSYSAISTRTVIFNNRHDIGDIKIEMVKPGEYRLAIRLNIKIPADTHLTELYYKFLSFTDAATIARMIHNGSVKSLSYLVGESNPSVWDDAAEIKWFVFKEPKKQESGS
jgi:hypothetical protein